MAGVLHETSKTPGAYEARQSDANYHWKGWIEKSGGRCKAEVTGQLIGRESDRAWVLPPKLELRMATDANEALTTCFHERVNGPLIVFRPTAHDPTALAQLVTYIQKAHQAKHLDVLVACLGPAAIPIEGYETPARESTLHVTSRAVMRHLLGVEKCLEMGVLDREEEGNSHELFGFVLLRHETGVFRKPRSNPTFEEMATAIQSCALDPVASKKWHEDLMKTAAEIMSEHERSTAEYNRLANEINESVIAQLAARRARSLAASAIVQPAGIPLNLPGRSNGMGLRDQSEKFVEFQRRRMRSPQPSLFDDRDVRHAQPPPRGSFRRSPSPGAPARPPPGSAQEKVCTLWVGNISPRLRNAAEVVKFCRYLGLSVADATLLKRRPGESEDSERAGFVTLESEDAVMEALILFQEQRDRFRGMLLRPRIPEVFTARGWVPGPGQFAVSNKSVADVFRTEESNIPKRKRSEEPVETNGRDQSDGKLAGKTDASKRDCTEDSGETKRDEKSNLSGKKRTVVDGVQSKTETEAAGKRNVVERNGVLKVRREYDSPEANSEGKENVPKPKRNRNGSAESRGAEGSDGRKRKDRSEESPEKNRAPLKRLRQSSPERRYKDVSGGGYVSPPRASSKSTDEQRTVEEVQRRIRKKLDDNDFVREWIQKSKGDAEFAKRIVWVGGTGVQGWMTEDAIEFFSRLPRDGTERRFSVAMVMYLPGKVLAPGKRTKKSFLVELRSSRESQEILRLYAEKHQLFKFMSMKAHEIGKKIERGGGNDERQGGGVGRSRSPQGR